MTIQMNSVQSTSIAAVGYRRRTMNVIFTNGKSYQFKKVPRAQFDRFTSSGSKGKFFNEQIKAVYPYVEM